MTRLCLDLENPVGIGTVHVSDEMFIRMENFSDSVNKFESAGPSANSFGVIVKNLVFFRAFLKSKLRSSCSFEDFVPKTQKTIVITVTGIIWM